MSDKDPHGTARDEEDLHLGKAVVIPTVGSGEIATRREGSVAIMAHEHREEYIVPPAVAREWATGPAEDKREDPLP